MRNADWRGDDISIDVITVGKCFSRLLQTANVNLYHVTKFSPYFSFTVYCFYIKIKRFMPVLPISIVLDCFYLLIFHSEKFSTDVCCLPFAVNVNLNLSALFSASR